MNSCREEILDFIHKAEQKLGSKYVISAKHGEKLDAICDGVDYMIHNFNCELFDLNLNPIIYSLVVDDGERVGVLSHDSSSRQFQIEIVCDEIVVENDTDSPFFKFITLADSFSFIQHDANRLVIAINFDDFWEVRRA